MQFTSIPEPTVVLAEIEPLSPHLYTALEYGTMKAREYFDQENGGRTDYYLAPEIVRFHAKRYLDSVAEGLFRTEPLARNGLYITEFRGLEIRVFKADDGVLPAPSSRAKHDFYQQLTLAVFEPAQFLKLVVLWDVNGPYNLSQLTLACPRSSDMTRGSVEAHWYAPIPYPIPVISALPPDISDKDDGLGGIIKRKQRDTGTDNDKKKK